MKRLKKVSIIFCVLIMLVSVLAVPVSAASQDRYHMFSWAENDREDQTNLYRKADNSPTYFRVANNSMPVGGFYMNTLLGPTGGPYPSSSGTYLITTYGGKTLKHTITNNATNQLAGLHSMYPSDHWSWGNVVIYWSEDYVEDGSARLNW